MGSVVIQFSGNVWQNRLKIFFGKSNYVLHVQVTFVVLVWQNHVHLLNSPLPNISTIR